MLSFHLNMNLCTRPLFEMICLTSVSWFQAHSVLPYMGFVSFFSLKGCAQMALASHHIHLNPGSQLTKQAPRGWRATDSHLLTPPPRATTTTKMAADAPFTSHTERDSSRQPITVIASVCLKTPGSLSFRLHTVGWWTVIHLWFAKALRAYSRAAGWGPFSSKALLAARMFTFSTGHIDSSI